MFKIFSFGLSNIFNSNNVGKLNVIMNSFLDGINTNELLEETHELMDEEQNGFIQLKQYEDMYLLTIDLRGVDLRELSIRYDPGELEINLNRSEVEKIGIGILSNNVLVKKAYNKKFDNIEDIETNQILKSIDNGILSIRMQKKYKVTNIVDVDFYEDNIDN